jgi:hypothetical protein
MKLNKLTTAIVGVMMTAGVTSSALAGVEVSPKMTLADRALFACTEQTLSIIAATADAVGCRALVDKVSYEAYGYYDGSCSAQVDDLFVYGVATLDDPRGTIIQTAVQHKSDYKNTKVQDLEGEFAFSPEGEIMLHTSYMTLTPDGHYNPEYYDEHVTKDYFGDKVFGLTECDVGLADPKTSQCKPLWGIKDKGLEAITKTVGGYDLPRAKWREHSQFLEPDGHDGLHSITKKLTVIKLANKAPTTEPCTIRINKADVYDFGSGLQAWGDIVVVDK